jgi:hypothetical protein
MRRRALRLQEAKGLYWPLTFGESWGEILTLGTEFILDRVSGALGWFVGQIFGQPKDVL